MACLVLLPAGVRAEGIDTEHIYGFMIGTDVGERGEREFQSETTGRFSRQGGSYQAVGQQLIDNHTAIDHAQPRCNSRKPLSRVIAIICSALRPSLRNPSRFCPIVR